MLGQFCRGSAVGKWSRQRQCTGTSNDQHTNGDFQRPLRGYKIPKHPASHGQDQYTNGKPSRDGSTDPTRQTILLVLPYLCRRSLGRFFYFKSCPIAQHRTSHVHALAGQHLYRFTFPRDEAIIYGYDPACRGVYWYDVVFGNGDGFTWK